MKALSIRQLRRQLVALLDNEPALRVITLALLVALVAFIGTMTYLERQADQAAYCQYVREGIYPDWRRTYARDCVEVRP